MDPRGWRCDKHIDSLHLLNFHLPFPSLPLSQPPPALSTCLILSIALCSVCHSNSLQLSSLISFSFLLRFYSSFSFLFLFLTAFLTAFSYFLFTSLFIYFPLTSPLTFLSFPPFLILSSSSFVSFSLFSLSFYFHFVFLNYFLCFFYLSLSFFLSLFLPFHCISSSTNLALLSLIHLSLGHTVMKLVISSCGSKTVVLRCTVTQVQRRPYSWSCD